MPYYENVFIARQDVSAAQVEALADSFAGIITQAGGTIHRREYWGLKTLNFRIRKNRKGHYVLLNVETTSEAMREAERQMGLNEDVLRHMTVRTETLPEGQSAVMQNRGDRGERGDRPERGDRFDRGDRGDRGFRSDRGPRDGERSDRPARGRDAGGEE